MKAYGSDQAFRVCETAIQVHGGAGFTRDYPVEQYCRDAKIFSIYEGTNHIQSIDLVARKLMQAGGAQREGVPRRHRQRFIDGAQGAPACSATRSTTLEKAHEAVGRHGDAVPRLRPGRPGVARAARVRALPRDDDASSRSAGSSSSRRRSRARPKEVVADEHPDSSFYEGKKYAARLLRAQRAARRGREGEDDRRSATRRRSTSPTPRSRRSEISTSRVKEEGVSAEEAPFFVGGAGRGARVDGSSRGGASATLVDAGGPYR